MSDSRRIARVERWWFSEGKLCQEYHYVDGTPGGVVHEQELHITSLFSRDDYLGAAAAAGFEATWDDQGIATAGATGHGLLICHLKGEGEQVWI